MLVPSFFSLPFSGFGALLGPGLVLLLWECPAVALPKSLKWLAVTGLSWGSQQEEGGLGAGAGS